MNTTERTILLELLDHTAFQAKHADRSLDRGYWSAQNDALLELQRLFVGASNATHETDHRTQDSFDADDGPALSTEQSQENKLCAAFRNAEPGGPSYITVGKNATPEARRNADLGRQSHRDDNALEG